MKNLRGAQIFGAFGVSLLVLVTLGFTGPTNVLAAGPAAVNIGSAGNFVVLAKSGISTTGATSITGNIGVSPISATAITGFGLIMDSSNTFSTSAIVTGKVYAADYTAPIPAMMTTAVSDMQTAYTDAAGRAADTVGLGAGNIGGLTIVPGVYKWGTGVTIPTDVTLSGGANDVWIFQVAGNLDESSGKRVNLSGGAQASNVFWQVAGQTTIGTTAVFSGNILDQTAVVLNTGATLNGRALAQTAVTIDHGTISSVGGAIPAPASTPAPVQAPVVTNQVSQSVPVAAASAPTIPAPMLLATSKLPNTGIGPDENNGMPWNMVIATGLLVILASLYLVRKNLTV